MDENISLVTESGRRLPPKERTSPLDPGLIHLHRFHEHRRPRGALSILDVAWNTLPKALRHESTSQRRCQERGPYKLPRIIRLLTTATNCEFLPDSSRQNPVCAKLTGPTIGCLSCRAPAEQKVNENNRPIPLATFGIFSSMQRQSKQQTKSYQSIQPSSDHQANQLPNHR